MEQCGWGSARGEGVSVCVRFGGVLSLLAASAAMTQSIIDLYTHTLGKF